MFDSGMIMSFHGPNLSPVPYSTCNTWLPCRARLPRLQMSSALVQTHQDGNFSEPQKMPGPDSALTKSNSKNSLLVNQPNTVGIMGGISVLSTLLFLEKLLCWSSRNSRNSLPFILCNDPALSLWFNNAKRDSGMIIENLRQKRSFLEQAGAGCIVIPCHISHVWHSDVFQGCSVQFLHAGDCVAEELREARLKPIEAGSSNVRIGLIGTRDVLNSGLYQEKVQNQGFEVILPDRATMSNIVTPGIEALHNRDVEGARNLVRIAIQILLIKAVNTVILASDEFQSLLPHNDPLLKKCIDPIDALARSTIRWAKSAKNAQMKT